MKNFIRKNWFNLIAVVLSFSALIFSIFFTSDIESISKFIENINGWWILLGVGIMVVFWTLDGYSLFVITKIQYPQQKLFNSIKTGIVGIFYGALTPFAIGGQPMQVMDMAYSNIDPGDATSVITIKTIIHQCSLTAYGIGAVILTASFFFVEVPHFIVLVGVGLALNILFILAIVAVCVHKKFTTVCARKIVGFLTKVKIVKNQEKATEKVLSEITIFHQSYLIISKQKPLLIYATIITFIQLTIFYLIPYCVYRSFGMPVQGILYIVCANAIITMITAFVPMPGGSGAAEGSFYLFFRTFMPEQVVIPAILLWRLLTYYSSILVGGMVTIYDIIKPHKLSVTPELPDMETDITTKI